MNNPKAGVAMDMQADKSAELAARREALVQAHPRYRHWEVLLAVEQDFETISRYVDICESNYKTCSIELYSLVLKSCTEIEKLCKRISGAPQQRDFKDFTCPLNELYPEFSSFEVEFPLWDFTVSPWKSLQSKNPVPPWWTCYNKIKHDEKDARQAGNLWVCLNAVAGLYVSTLYYEIFTYPLHRKKTGTPRIILNPWMSLKYMQPDSNLVKRGISIYSGEPLLDWK